jgi:hypothetical protein
MADYIDRKKLMDDISKYSIENYAGLIRNVVMKQPVVDVAPVIHGEWIEALTLLSFGQKDKVIAYKCSACGAIEFEKHPYCHCGANMDGGKK